MKKAKVLLLLCVSFAIMFLLSSTAFADAGLSVSVTPGVYPGKTVISWVCKTYALYGLNAQSYNINIDGEFVATVDKNTNSYSVVLIPGVHTATVTAKLSATASKSTTEEFYVSKSSNYKTVTYKVVDGDVTPGLQVAKHGDEIKISEIVPKKTGKYVFAGWATTKGASKAQYQPGDSYTDDKDITLYPVWRKYYISGSCGENVKYHLFSDGELSIDGYGAMNDYGKSDMPWYDYFDVIKKVTITGDVTSVGNYAFAYCSNLAEVVITDNVTKIGKYAFFKCYALEDVTFPGKLIEIDRDAFCDCTGLKEIILPDSVSEMDSYVFRNCSSLTKVKISKSMTYIPFDLFYDCSNLETVILPEGVTEIKAEAFYNCSSLKEISIPDSVINLNGDAIFYGCEALESVVIPSGTTQIGDECFYGCTSLNNVKIPETVTWIDDSAFENCTSFADITLPNDITYIGQSTFRNSGYYNNPDNWDGDILYYNYIMLDVNRSLSGECIIKPGTKVIPDNFLFSNCEQLTSVRFPFGLRNIGGTTFSKCTRLKEVCIPETVIAITENPFYQCDNLERIYYSGTLEQWKECCSVELDGVEIICNSNVYDVATPKANYENGEIEKNSLIELFSDTSGATVYYTTNGEMPTVNSEKYVNPILINDDVEIKAIAVKEGYKDSSVATFSFNVKKHSLINYEATYKKASTYYKVYIDSEKPIDNAFIHIGLFDSNGCFLSVVSEICEGDNYYIITVPLCTGADSIKTFIWTDDMQPMALSKKLKIN